jgi:acyl carrier protein
VTEHQPVRTPVDAAFFDAFAQIIRRVFPDHTGPLTADTVAADVDGWDSLAHANVILEAEQHFHAKLPVEELYRTRSLGDLVERAYLALHPVAQAPSDPPTAPAA